MSGNHRTQPVSPQVRLQEFHADFRKAEERLRLARQTLAGAEMTFVQQEARFKGALEALHGPDARYRYNPDEGLVVESTQTG